MSLLLIYIQGLAYTRDLCLFLLSNSNGEKGEWSYVRLCQSTKSSLANDFDLRCDLFKKKF